MTPKGAVGRYNSQHKATSKSDVTRCSANIHASRQGRRRREALS